MKIGFKKSLKQKTDKELEIIAKDHAFYSPAERLQALKALEARNSLTKELSEKKKIIAPLNESSEISEYEENEDEPIEISPEVQKSLDLGRKIYREEAVWSAVIGGGPFVGGYILAQNYKTFGEPEKARKVWKYAFKWAVIIFCIIMLIPDDIGDIPYILAPALITLPFYFYFKRHQRESVYAYLALSGEYFRWWRTLFIGIVGAGVYVLFIVGMVFVSTSITTTTRVYGESGHEITFSRFSISTDEADKIADVLTAFGWFGDENEPKWVEVERRRNRVEITLWLSEYVPKNDHNIQFFRYLGTVIQSRFPENPVVLKLKTATLFEVFLGTGNVTRLDGFEFIPFLWDDGFFDEQHIESHYYQIINGMRWATRNVDTPGVFVENPEDAGGLFVFREARLACPPGWRLPSCEEIVELARSFDSWTSINGAGGGRFKAMPIVPIYIFLPAVGYYDADGVLQYAGKHGYYWVNCVFHEEELTVSSMVFCENDEVRFMMTENFYLRKNVRCVVDE